jgi:hypothetical protein
MYRLMAICGWLLGFFALCMAGVYLDKTLDGTNNAPVLMAVMTAIMGFGGFQLVRMGRRGAKDGRLRDGSGQAQSPEHVVLRLARDRGGEVTAAQVAADSALSFDDAQAELDTLARKGACEVDATEDGVVIYRFGGLVARR